MSNVANYEKEVHECPYCHEICIIKYGHTKTGVFIHF